MTPKLREAGLLIGLCMPWLNTAVDGARWFQSTDVVHMVGSWVIFGVLLWGLVAMLELMRHIEGCEKQLTKLGVDPRKPFVGM